MDQPPSRRLVGTRCTRDRPGAVAGAAGSVGFLPHGTDEDGSGDNENMTSSQHDRSEGLRERKKARTRAAIQRHALRLFREQGFHATTVDQIAAAADLSQSTFFRYFPTKEATVLYDQIDPMLMQMFVAQPADLAPTAALRAALRQALHQLSAGEEWQLESERQALIFSVPELQAAMAAQLRSALAMLAQAIADRAGRSPDDFAVRNVSGAVVGVVMSSAFLTSTRSLTEFVELIDEALGHLEAGLPL